MGEVVMSSENEMEMEMARVGEKGSKNMNVAAEGGAAAAAPAVEGSCEAVRWERFLPKMVVRVLLVEADDSTRQIISALLRKCSYRVAAVSDGLKAWEVLKARPHNIDLILTEVDLPSISGYALLTLIMEHDVCKNIPVIMMSSQDSVSTVYKCMLRGATDFLVKPVRKNELRNLWQHVWRKQASSTAAGPGPPDESVAQEKDEATAENNATSNHSSGYMSCIQRNKEGIEKGIDAQSSCTKPGSEIEEEDIEHVHDPSKPESVKCLSDGVSTPGQEECHQQNSKKRARDSETQGLQEVAKSDADYAATQEDKGCDHNEEQTEYFLREAIDLIGNFDNHLKGSLGTSALITSASKFDISPMLDLSLRRTHHVSQVNDERPRLNHSDASAFSRYVNKPLQLSPSTCNQQKDHEMSSEKQPSNHISDYSSDTRGPTLNSPRMPASAAVQAGWPEFTFSYSQNRDISHPIPVRGVGFGNVPRSPPLPSQGATYHSEPFPQSNPFYQSDHQPSSSQQLHSPADHRNSNSVDQTENKQGNKTEELEDQGLISHGTNQSANSSFCNGNMSHHHSQVSGCNGTINGGGSGHEESFHLHDGPSHRAMQREAALTKFRQKRKDRCFEKKVRYESRKKLAEQRPRVKGQFVRQLPTDQPGSSSAG
ncbi:two-component response regulator-like APRR5 [Salvia miltiorrhiza]|uniref:two-component response regulator-like APRR5 n=1 Tax=Salvia miltiorrhiza TaxID=226208 RepID=UPI0025AD9449|nr:two-component response regulator-like APRR5 [Salvia miltiorrhiza]